MLIIIPGAAMDPVWRNCSAAEAKWALSACLGQGCLPASPARCRQRPLEGR